MNYRSLVAMFVLALASLFLFPAAASEAAKPGLVVPVTGVTEDGSILNGQLAVLHFRGWDYDKLVARVHIKGILTDATGDSTKLNGSVQLQVTWLDTHEFCHLMTFRFGATDVRLQGQVVHLDTIVIQIAEDPERGIDGQNLCTMAGRFDELWFEDLAARLNDVLRALSGKA